MKVLVTGGGGFIGAWIARRLLAEGHAVRVFDRARGGALLRRLVGPAAETVEWSCGDIARAEDVASALAGCGGVIHLAGLLTPECGADPLLGLQVNVAGALNVFEAARRAGLARVVYSSSAGVYGAKDGEHPAPDTLYGVYKLACEGVARVHWLEHGVASAGIRPYIVYGPGREGGGSAGSSLACRAAARGERYTIPYTGTAGMVYVEDVADAFVRALFAPQDGAHVFNLQGETADMDRILACIRAVVPDARVDARGAPLRIAPVLPADGLREMIPGLMGTPLAQGIAATIEMYRRWEG